MEDESPVLVERCAGYRVITLNRPKQLNAFNEAMHQALKRALAEAEDDSDCRALMLTGAGRAFCSGQDLRDRLSKDGKTTVLGSALETYYNPLVRKLRALPFPVVAAVNGVAAGAGANIALACDVVLAARSATFVQAFAKIGLVPDSGGSFFLPRLIGEARAKEMVLLGRRISAARAFEIGLVHQIVPRAGLAAAVEALLAELATCAPLSVQSAKSAIQRGYGKPLPEALDIERECYDVTLFSMDRDEGLAAFAEGRPPNYRGH
jgi:2-(1,2-epoxy-1,2-dihydrophenyl)acetyl-CoA isomerase